tara:strand:+ start:117 stop:500 length:384 start_codon:yes stop_codon:yes gene_type:complete
MTAPVNFSRCSQIKGFVTGYEVIVADDSAANTILLTLVDPVNSMQNSEQAKTILMKALDDYLVGASQTAAVYASCPCCERSQGGPGMTFYAGSKVLKFTASGLTKPGTAVKGTVPLPLKCAVVVVFA